MYFMPDTISRFTCRDTTQTRLGGALQAQLLPAPPAPQRLPYSERNFYPVLHALLQHKGLLLEALQITCAEKEACTERLGYRKLL